MLPSAIWGPPAPRIQLGFNPVSLNSAPPEFQRRPNSEVSFTVGGTLRAADIHKESFERSVSDRFEPQRTHLARTCDDPLRFNGTGSEECQLHALLLLIALRRLDGHVHP